MKTNEKKDLVQKTTDELKMLLQEARKKLVSLKLDHSQLKLKNTREIFLTRKDIARFLTKINEKEQQK